jgi:hypothetical protein
MFTQVWLGLFCTPFAAQVRQDQCKHSCWNTDADSGFCALAEARETSFNGAMSSTSGVVGTCRRSGILFIVSITVCKLSRVFWSEREQMGLNGCGTRTLLDGGEVEGLVKMSVD